VRRRECATRGVALVAVLFVLLALAALVAALFFAALQEHRIGRNTAAARRAFDAAEAGLAAALARWAGGGLGLLDSGRLASLSGALPGGTGEYSVVARRLSTRLFLIRSEGWERTATARSHLAVIARLVPQPLEPGGALTSAGSVTVAAPFAVDGAGGPPGGTGCDGPPDTAAGLVLADTSLLALEGCVAGACVRGRPAVAGDVTLGLASPPVVGESGWAALVSLADTVRSGVQPAPPGSPGRILYAPGDLALAGIAVSGIVLVEGDLLLTGAARVDGLVIVRGTMRTDGAGGLVTGAAIAGAAELRAAIGGAGVAFSRCSLGRALRLAAPAQPLPERGWAELF
jgi:hypothetical protein